MTSRICIVLPIVLVSFVNLVGCRKDSMAQEPVIQPDYARQLRPGEPALRLITDQARLPDLGAAYRNRDVFLLDALDQSVSWFAAPSSKQFFPFENITHEQARVSCRAFLQIVQSAGTETEFVEEIKRKFDVYESVGYNGEGIVLFTGYYSPDFRASRTRTLEYTHPLYKRPADLATDPKTGEPLGRTLPGGGTAPYLTRAEIERTNMFAGNELVWVKDAMDAYIIHVNGSAKLKLDDGTTIYIGYAGKTDRPYVGLGQTMVEAGLLKPNELSLKAIRKKFRENPEAVKELMNRNESYVFFTEYSGESWPSGSLGRKVTAERSLATDKRIYPRGGVLLVDTQVNPYELGKRPFVQFMLDQDTGGAIRAPGRADIFMGIGASSEILAGGQYAEGRLYYFFLKPEFIGEHTGATAMK